MYRAPCCGPFVLLAYPPFPVVREIDADQTVSTATGLVGGIAPARLTIEYLVGAGASAPSVGVDIVANGQTTSWSDNAPATGYHVADKLAPAPPGAQVKLTVNNAEARVRWCETICC